MNWLPLVLSLTQLVSTNALTLDESPKVAGEWGFRPADGSTTMTNPPAFVWRPVKEATAYVVEVARNGDFTEGAQTWDALTWSSYAPDKTLDAGDWYWRYAAVDSEGTQSAWSQSRHFTVAADAHAFPKPTMDALVARIPTEHPRLFIRPEEVGPLRDAAAGPMKARRESLIAHADKVLASPPDTTEPPKYPEGTVRKSKEWKVIWWGNRKKAVAVANSAAELAFVYQLTGDTKYADEAKRLLLAICEWDPRGATGYTYNDEAGMPLLYYPSRAYSWVHDQLSPEERQKVIDVMTIRGGDCFNYLRRAKHLWRPYSSHSNRAWHFLGEVAIAFQGEIPEAKQWIDYAVTVFYTCYPVWGGEDGGWHEGLAYWSSYMGRFMYWTFASQAAFDIDPFEKPFFATTGYYAMYSMPPGTKEGSWGDQAQRMSSKSIAGLMRTFASGAKNAHWQWYGETNGAGPPGGYMGIIQSFRSGDITAKVPSELPSSRVFPAAGIGVLNTDLLDGRNNIQLQLKSSPFGRSSHGYNANNAILLSMAGERVFRKTGKRDIYGSPHHKEWMWETKSDNAILVNGKGQAPHSAAATGQITHFQTSDELDILVGEAGASYDALTRWTRRIIFLKPYGVVIHDVLEAAEPSDFQWLLHATGSFEIDGQGAFWKGPGGAVDVEFVYPADLKISQTKKYDTPPHDWANFDLDEVHLTAATTEKQRVQEFITVMSFNDVELEYKHERTGDVTTLAIALPDRAVALQLSPEKFEVRGD